MYLMHSANSYSKQILNLHLHPHTEPFRSGSVITLLTVLNFSVLEMHQELIEKTREKQSAMLSEVTWRSRTVPVKNEQVRVFLLSVQDTEKRLAEANSPENKLSIYESLLKELIDAQQALKEELKEDAVGQKFTV